MRRPATGAPPRPDRNSARVRSRRRAAARAPASSSASRSQPESRSPSGSTGEVMHTQSANGHPSLGTAAKEVTDHAKTLVKLELELATLELKRKVAALGLGIGLLLGGGILALFGLGFLFATVAAALATFLATWLALLIVALGTFALTGVLALVGLS